MGKITTHVLDTAHGTARRRHEDRALGLEGEAWKRLKSVTTNKDGRTDEPLPRAALCAPGQYQLCSMSASTSRRRTSSTWCRSASASATPARTTTCRCCARRGATPPIAAAEAVDAYLLDWLTLLLRWAHIVVGIAWIGASFYFIWLDNHLEAQADRRTRASAASSGRCTAAASTTRRNTASRPPRCRRRCTGSSGRPTGPGSPASPCSCWSTTLNAELYLIDPRGR